MPGSVVVVALISTVGTLSAALGATALTYAFTARREDRSALRQRQEARAQARGQACAELLSAATRLKVQVEVISRRQWEDMNLKLMTIQDHAISVNLAAASVALLIGGEAGQAAQALAVAAGTLAADVTAAANIEPSVDPAQQRRAGILLNAPDLRDLDGKLEKFHQVAFGVLAVGV